MDEETEMGRVWTQNGGSNGSGGRRVINFLSCLSPAKCQSPIWLENWSKSVNFVIIDIDVVFLLYINRWVFRRFLVADGNFKADHIRQKSNPDDVWLSEGGGMMPKRDEYETFLKNAIERRTASIFTIDRVSLNYYFRELPVKITFVQLSKPCSTRRLATLLA